MIKFFIPVFACLLFTANAQARPVSYPEGWTAMTMNNLFTNSSHIHYSPTATYSIGWRHDYLRDSKANVDTLQLNTLLKRWNAPGQQANLYLKSGVGVAVDDGDTGLAAFTGLATDWETRRYFVSYENRFFAADTTDNFARHQARVGIAPYIGDYGDLHTWLMLEVDYEAGRDNNFTATPLVRLFKNSTMVEAGYNLDDGILFNFVQRF